ncbi:CHAP domain-containing protein [Streptomyces sp. NPDC057620]|uniref:CHAP domain-containing protein n=1 Tax=Streptomyces sp. NPDC057620 TaxID=3346185 RepID=UPI0036C702CC
MNEKTTASDGLGGIGTAGRTAEEALLEDPSPIGEEDIADASLATETEAPQPPPGQEVGTQQAQVALSGADRAVAWYRARLGSTAYEGWCERAARRLAWGCPAKYRSAIDHWKRGGPRHTTGTPPKGAFVFWNIGRFGHVGLADGKGGFYATGVKGRIGHASGVGYYRKYVGWIPGGCG